MGKHRNKTETYYLLIVYQGKKLRNILQFGIAKFWAFM
jgi:hypothetical protein